MLPLHLARIRTLITVSPRFGTSTTSFGGEVITRSADAQMDTYSVMYSDSMATKNYNAGTNSILTSRLSKLHWSSGGNLSPTLDP
jgi:hypothetical protein